MHRVLFVCLGNICRSPLAEGVLQKLIADQGFSTQFQIDSAGTVDHHVGDLPDPRSIQVARKHGCALTHRARQFTAKDFQDFDYILVMDRSNYRNVTALAKSAEDQSKVQLFGPDEVPDPYYQGEEAFELVYQQLLTYAQAFLTHTLTKRWARPF